MTRSATSLGILLSLGTAAGAQDWLTREVCDVPAIPSVHEELLTQHEWDAAREAASAIDNPNGRLWRIETNTGAVSHLFGTFHSSAAPILDLPDEVQARLETARKLAVEIDYRPVSNPELEAARDFSGWWQNVNLPPKPMEFVSGADPRLGQWAEERILALGYSPFDSAYLSSLGRLQLIMSEPCEDFSGGVIPYQDSYLVTRAHIAGIPVVGLEARSAMEDALKETDGDTLARAMISVYSAYLQPRADNRPRESGMALYLSGQLALLTAIDGIYLRGLLGPAADTAIARSDNYLLAARNRDFLEAAIPELEEGGLFIGVGAGHLPGEDGLVSMLRRAGYSLERVTLPGEVP